MAGVLVGGALLSSFFNVLFDRLSSPEVIDFFPKKLIEKLEKELDITLSLVDALLSDAEEKQLADQNVKKWLDEIKYVLYEADHLTDKINTEASRHMVEEGGSRSKSCKGRNCIPRLFNMFDIKSETGEVLYRLKFLLEKKDMLHLGQGFQNRPLRRLAAPLVEESDVHGREDDKNTIIKLLLSHDLSGHKISVIPIVGMGGIGKTTVAQLVYNDRRALNHFECTVWVTVSEEFDVFETTKVIFEKVTRRKCETKDLYQLQSQLKAALAGKRFLFVLDDLWNDNYNFWDLLVSPFESGAHGSKIIVTTRSKIVVSRLRNIQTCYDLQIISDENCWRLFARHAFDDVDSVLEINPDLHEIGIQIVKKCKGIPSVVKSMAGLLRSTSSLERWTQILESDTWELQKQNQNILLPLWSSYHFLPPSLKRCFSYFSIFPRGYIFDESEKKKIIMLWMAEGLLQSQNGRRIEDVGREYLDALISMSLISQKSDSTLIMHDLMHDLAMHISGEFCSMSEDSSCKDNRAVKTLHFSYRKDSGGMLKFEGLLKTKCKLRTFLALPLSDKYSSESMLTQEVLHKLLRQTGGCLRVLSLSQSSITELPDKIGKLKYLRYLDLSWTKLRKLPSSVFTLYNLQTLLLSHCKELTKLPKKVCGLINLRHLYIIDVPFKEMPPGICNMKNLQTLTDFVLDENGGHRIKELGALPLLDGSFSIRGLENVTDVSHILEADLKNKKYLTGLHLSWKDSLADDSAFERQQLDALKPHISLLELKISGYRSTMFPDWVAHPSYHNLAKVSLISCKNCFLLPPLGQLPSLRELLIWGMDLVISIGDEVFGASLSKQFPTLESLTIGNMTSLEQFTFGDDPGRCLFPCLKELHLSRCPRLRLELPAAYFPSLSSVEISHCNAMEAIFPRTSVHFMHVKDLIIQDCKNLIAKRMDLHLQQLSSLKSLDLHGSLTSEDRELAMDSFPENGLLPESLTHLRIDSFQNLKRLNGQGFQQLSSLQQLTISRCEELECLPEGLPTSLTHLQIYGCPLLNQRCSSETGEDWPKIAHIATIETD